MSSSDSNREPGRAPDADLIRLIRSGKSTDAGRAAANELLGRYRRAVYLWCFRYVKDHERALDLSQDVLLRAWRGLDSFGGRSGFSSWLFAITRNRCLDEVKRVDVLADDESDVEQFPAAGANPALQMEERESEERIYKLMLTALEPVERWTLWLRCFERLPVDEITHILGIDQASGARGILQTARRKLKAALGEPTND
jgi:RNA polymerase sigma-70 factor (ECF subfamily)